MRTRKNLNFNRGPYMIVVVVALVLLIWSLGTSSSRSFFTTTPIKSWNTIDPDVSTNGNTLYALAFLQSKKSNLTPTAPPPSLVFNKPFNYYGKYLQFSGTVKSVQSSSPPSKLESIALGSSTEIIVLANDGRTLIDFFLIGRMQSFSTGAPITLFGYTPGIRYVQNTQGVVTPGLVIIGSLYK